MTTALLSYTTSWDVTRSVPKNRRSISHRSDGAPGECIAPRPVNFCIHPAGRPINTSMIEVLRRPIEFAQFPSFAFTSTLKDVGIRISMDGCGRWMDNVFIERLWRSLNYECVFLSAFETAARRAAASVPGSTITTSDARTQPSPAGRPTRSMLWRK